MPYHIIGCIFIFKYCVLKLRNKSFTFSIDRILFLFIVLCGLSIVKAMYINDNNTFVNSIDGGLVNIGFSSSNVTQYIYILFSFVIYICVATYLCENKECIDKVIRVFMISIVSVCILGIIQELIYIILKDTQIFNTIFRNNSNINTQGMGDLLRMSSVFIEPSILSQFLSPALVIPLFYKNINFKKRITIVSIILICGILSTSTTFIVGLCIFILILLLNHIDVKKISMSKLRILICSMFLLCSMFFIVYIGLKNENSFISDFYNDMISKISLNNRSGVVRSSHLELHLKVGLKYPILGVGFGTARSSDLLSTWIANIGVITTSIFFIYVIKLLRKLKQICNKNNIADIYYYYIFILLSVSFISVPEPYYIYIWIAFALGKAIIYHEMKDKKGREYEYINS